MQLTLDRLEEQHWTSADFDCGTLDVSGPRFFHELVLALRSENVQFKAGQPVSWAMYGPGSEGVFAGSTVAGRAV